MGMSYEWFNARTNSVYLADPGTQLGDYPVDGEVALVLENGGGAAVLEGSLEDMRRIFKQSLDAVENMLRARGKEV